MTSKKVILLISLLIISIGVLVLNQATIKGSVPFGNTSEESLLNQWIHEIQYDSEIPQILPQSIRGISIIRDNIPCFEATYELRTYKENYDYWNISNPYEGTVTVNTEELYNLFERIVKLEFKQVDNRKLLKKDVGLLNPKTSLFIGYDNTQINGEKGKNIPNKGYKIYVGNINEDGQYYIGLEGSEKIYQINQLVLDSILQLNPFDYILKISHLVHIQSVESVEIISPFKRVLLKRDETSYKIDGKNVDETLFNNLYSQLMSVLIEDEIPKGYQPDQDREPILTIRYNCHSKEVPDCEVHYFAYNDEYATVNVNGVEKFLVSLNEVEKLRDTLNNY